METKEQIEINKLKQEVYKLRTITDSLCMTNFLVDYQEGDEDVRNWAKSNVNFQRQRIVDRYKAAKEHNDLWNQQREIQERMLLIEQDYPHLRENQEMQMPVSYEQYRTQGFDK
jgi:hypothetical protein